MIEMGLISRAEVEELAKSGQLPGLMGMGGMPPMGPGMMPGMMPGMGGMPGMPPMPPGMTPEMLMEMMSQMGGMMPPGMMDPSMFGGAIQSKPDGKK